MIESQNPKEMIVSTINYNRDITILYFLKQKINDVEQENINLTFEIMSSKEIEKNYINLMKAENRLRELRQSQNIVQCSPHALQQGKPDHVKMSKLKESIAQIINENANLQLQIDSIEKRINLMQRKKSYIPMATLPTPRRKRPRFLKSMNYQISRHPSLERDFTMQ